MRFVFARAIPAARPYRGLTRVVRLRQFRVKLKYGGLRQAKDLRVLIPVPLGWMWLRDPQRDEVLVGPWWVMMWLYLPARYADVVFWLADFGVFVGPEDGYLREYHLTWPWRWHMRRRSRAT